MTTPTTAHGTRREHDGQIFVEFTRTFRAPVADVWAAVTEPERLARWVGTWQGDPASGEVRFRMIYEGDDVPWEQFVINECLEPRSLRVTATSPSDDGPQEWHLNLDLTETDGVTTLTFAQSLPNAERCTSHWSTTPLGTDVGPGWHYYLDRLVAAETGTDPAEILWDDYYPGLKDHYRAAFS